MERRTIDSLKLTRVTVLCAGEYTEAVAAVAEEHLDFVMGFISISPSKWIAKCSPGLIHMTPGVQLVKVRSPWRSLLGYSPGWMRDSSTPSGL